MAPDQAFTGVCCENTRHQEFQIEIGFQLELLFGAVRRFRSRKWPNEEYYYRFR
jgi:hypothetical protein